MSWDEIINLLTKPWVTVFRDFISAVGFTITIITLVRTRNAAIAARDAAQEATRELQKKLSKTEAITSLNAAVAKIEQITDFQSRQSFDRVPGFYRELRLLLAKLKGSNSALGDDDKAYVQGSISEFGQIERGIHTRLIQKQAIDDMPNINQIVSSHAEEFARMESELRDVGKADE